MSVAIKGNVNEVSIDTQGWLTTGDRFKDSAQSKKQPLFRRRRKIRASDSGWCSQRLVVTGTLQRAGFKLIYDIREIESDP